MTDNINDMKIEELKELCNNLIFYSDQVRFNLVIYENLKYMSEQLKKIEEKIDKLEHGKV